MKRHGVPLVTVASVVSLVVLVGCVAPPATPPKYAPCRVVPVCQITHIPESAAGITLSDGGNIITLVTRSRSWPSYVPAPATGDVFRLVNLNRRTGAASVIGTWEYGSPEANAAEPRSLNATDDGQFIAAVGWNGIGLATVLQVWDRSTGTWSAVPTPAIGAITFAGMSQNGRFVSYEAETLVDPTSPGTSALDFQLDLVDRQTSTTSVLVDTQLSHESFNPFQDDAISDDGRFVEFEELKELDTGLAWTVTELDRTTGTQAQVGSPDSFTLGYHAGRFFVHELDLKDFIGRNPLTGAEQTYPIGGPLQSAAFEPDGGRFVYSTAEAPSPFTIRQVDLTTGATEDLYTNPAPTVPLPGAPADPEPADPVAVSANGRTVLLNSTQLELPAWGYDTDDQVGLWRAGTGD
jgi:hypothetical protein